MTVLYLLWLVFAAVFFYFGWVQWRQMGQEIRPFQIREREGAEAQDSMNPDVSNDFNQYLEKINTENRNRSRVATITFFIAGLGACCGFLPVLALFYYAYLAYQGDYFEITYLTDFMVQQGWLKKPT